MRHQTSSRTSAKFLGVRGGVVDDLDDVRSAYDGDADDNTTRIGGDGLDFVGFAIFLADEGVADRGGQQDDVILVGGDIGAAAQHLDNRLHKSGFGIQDEIADGDNRNGEGRDPAGFRR